MVYAVSRNILANSGEIMYWNGYTWTNEVLPAGVSRLYGIWGISTEDIWAVGDHDGSVNCVLHFNGTTWVRDSLFQNTTLLSLTGVFGYATDDVYILGNKSNTNYVYHYDGFDWTLINTYTATTGINNLYKIRGMPQRSQNLLRVLSAEVV